MHHPGIFLPRECGCMSIRLLPPFRAGLVPATHVSPLREVVKT